MDNLGTEIGQKMRSAVKAKLIELGTGTATGYIDDELPDYVMIMVANKRSRSQMVDDLNLFLGTQTEVFVNWLHQVLQKLQEVTLPAAQKVSKRKNTEGTENNKDGKKEKKDKKKEKKIRKGQNKEITPPPPIITLGNEDDMPKTPPPPSLGVSSITEVFANQYIENAKKTKEIEEAVSKKEEPKTNSTPAAPENLEKEKEKEQEKEDEFDIPTITEIAENAVVQIRQQKELTELEELQKKIYAAKKQLKNMCSDDDEDEDDDDDDESEDEDFLHIKANDEELDTIEENAKIKKEKRAEKTKITLSNNNKEAPAKKKSILERLGEKTNVIEASKINNVISISAHRRGEKEIYVPLFRRKENEPVLSTFRTKEREKNSERDKDRAKERERVLRTRRERDRSRERERERERERNRNNVRNRFNEKNDRRDREREKSRSKSKEIRTRIGSRVIVMPLKADYHDEDKLDVPINSVIKVKPRQILPKNKQASKNLLLRAVAEAQKSTTSAMKAMKPMKPMNVMNPITVGANHRKVPIKKNLLIEIPGAVSEVEEEVYVEEEVDEDEVFEYPQEVEDGGVVDDSFGDEYIPEPIPSGSARSESDSDGIVYVPAKTTEKTVNNEEYDPVDENKTKFFVTLDGGYKSKKKMKKSKSPGRTPPPSAAPKTSHKASIKDRIGYKTKTSSKSTTPPPPVVPQEKTVEKENHNEVLMKRKERFSIKNIAKAAELTKTTSSSKRTKSPSKEKEVVKEKETEKTSEETVVKNDKPKQKSPEKKEKRDKKERERSKLNLNEILVRKTKELDDENMSSSPIYMSKSDYDKMEISSRKRHRVSPIQFNLTDEETKNSDDEYHTEENHNSRRSNNEDKTEKSGFEQPSKSRKNYSPKKIKKLESSRKFDDIPPLLSVISSDSSKSKPSSKDRCKYFPLCRQGDSCEFLHPATPCKAFPNCKFGDKCLYLHPKCKFDKTCTRLDCNFMHYSSLPSISNSIGSAPPLASSVVPVHNYKSISAQPLPALCKFYPTCTNNLCHFFHPKLCRFGKNCVNKIECNFYHHELPSQDKLKWVSPFSA